MGAATKTCEIVSGGKARESVRPAEAVLEQVLTMHMHVGFCPQETLLASHKHTLLEPYSVLACTIRSLPTRTTLDEFSQRMWDSLCLLLSLSSPSPLPELHLHTAAELPEVKRRLGWVGSLY